MHEVFVSYSTKDDALVRERLNLIAAAGVRYWLAPDDVPGGADFARCVDEAIGGSKVLLVMATANSLSSSQVDRELELADRRKLPVIPLLLQREVASSGASAYRLANRQYIGTIDRPDWLARLVKTLQFYNVTALDVSPAARRAATVLPSSISSGLLPYLADRDTQEEMVQQALEQHLAVRPMRPLLIIIHGDEVHCCDMFLERLYKHTIPEHLERLKQSNQLEPKNVRWPEQTSRSATPNLRRDAYGRQILTRLGLSLKASLDDLSLHLATLRRPVLFLSILGNETWQPDEPQFIEAVLTWWSQLPDIAVPSQPLIVLLSVSYTPSPQPLITRLFGRAGQSPVARQVLDLRRPAETALTTLVLPELTSLSLADVQQWVRERVHSDDIDDILYIVKAIFEGRRKDAELRLRQFVNNGSVDDALAHLTTILAMKRNTPRVPMQPLAPLLKTLVRSDKVLRSM